jgi:hypothetical protein
MTPEEIMKNEVEFYKLAVQALLAFNQHMEYEYKGKCYIAKKLRTSRNNRITPDEEITPDIVTKISDFGIVGDLKTSLPKNHDLWDEGIKQLEKYDDELIGWNGTEGCVKTHDLVALVHIARCYDFATRIEDKLKSGKLKFDRKWSVIGFGRDAQPLRTYILLKREPKALSSMSNKDMEKNLNSSKMIPFEHLINIETDFCDVRPPVVLTMSILWDHIFESFMDEGQRRESKGGSRIVEIHVNAGELQKRLHNGYAPKQEIEMQKYLPDKEWVVEALDEFEKIELAKKEDNENYIIKFKRPRGKEPLDFFIERICELNKKGPEKPIKSFIKNN